MREGRFYTLDPALFQYKPLERWDESYRVLWGYLYGGEDGGSVGAGEADAAETGSDTAAVFNGRNDAAR